MKSQFVVIELTNVVSKLGDKVLYIIPIRTNAANIKDAITLFVK
ncbi:hypothetical protein FNO01nite_34070 [Flavobacterium noncentrifugens]|nr:hypothetical protein FNO01nite_34070 [Flavobacterium noncentrifugens]